MSPHGSSNSNCLLIANYDGFADYVGDYLKRQLNCIGPSPWGSFIRRERRSNLYVIGGGDDLTPKIY